MSWFGVGLLSNQRCSVSKQIACKKLTRLFAYWIKKGEFVVFGDLANLGE